MSKLWNKLAASLRAFNRSRSGNVAITFAIATLPVIGAVGAAVDYSRANAVKAAMQAALDSTALMLSREAATLPSTELPKKAEAYLLAMLNRPDAHNITIISATYSTDGGSHVDVEGSADVPTTLMSAVGYDSITVKGFSTVRWGSTRLRVALALDNTGSMAQSGKMDALKAATKNLLDQLKAAAGKDGDVYVSIVPFATDVNVGSGNDKAAWLKFSGEDDTWDETNGTCNPQKNDKNRVLGNKQDCESYKVSKNVYGKWTPTAHSKWNGCVMDREKSPTAYNTSNASPSTTKPDSLFPAHQASSCPESVLPQTYSWTSLQNKVKAMTPTGNTNTTIGLVHAWQTLTDGAPYSPPPIVTSDGIPTRKIIIFLTDGENTQDRFGSRSSDIDDRMKTACANAKAGGITIFTVLMLEGNESLLKNCASKDDDEPKGPKYFKLTTAAQVATAFETIGTSLTKLRVAK